MYEKFMLHIKMCIFLKEQRGTDAEPSEFKRKNILFQFFLQKIAMFEKI
jgi:hypothetical protein